MGIPLHPAQSVDNLKTDMGGAIESSYVTLSALGTGSFESFTATFAAYASSAQGDYLSFTEPGGTKFAAWLNKNSNNTTPTGAVYVAADQKITVNLSSGTAAQVAAAFKSAIEANGSFDEFAITDNGAGVLTFTANKLGNPADAAPHNTGDTGAGSIATSVTSGSSATSQNKYIVLHDDDTGLFHVWLNVNGEGSDPNPGGGSVGIEVTVTTGMTDAQVATAMATAIDANSEFEASADGTRVRVTVATKAAVTDAGAGNMTGATVAASTQGVASKVSAAGSPSDISNNPSTF